MISDTPVKKRKEASAQAQQTPAPVCVNSRDTKQRNKKKPNLLRKLLLLLSGNRLSQKLLESNVRYSQFLMGIGSGSSVEISGERAVFQLVRLKLPAPYCVFDAGANIGQYLDIVFEEFRDDILSIHCFEPGEHSFGLLANRFENNSLVHMNKAALGKAESESTLYYDRPDSGLASLSRRKLDHFSIEFNHSEKVRVTTIDDYCEKNLIDHIHLLKIDVEGYELDVLKGANRMLAKDSIDFITFEFGGCNIDTCTYFQDFYYFFKNLDMKIYRITPSGYMRGFNRYREALEQFQTSNFVAIKNKFI